MSNFLGFPFWNAVARMILRNRILVLSLVIAFTVFLGFQWKNMRFSYTEANLLPDDHQVNLKYQDFVEIFGEEGNVIVMAVQDSSLFTPEKFYAWNELAEKLETFEEVDFTVSVGNLKKLKKFSAPPRFEMVPLVQEEHPDSMEIASYRKELFNRLPFYEGLIFSEKSKAVQTAVYLHKEIVNTKLRKEFIMQDLIPLVREFEKQYGLDVKVSGMPYIRTLNSQNIIDEIGLFIGAALLVTSLLLFFFFRSLRATLISMTTVIIGVMWSFGIIGLLHYEITVLTAIIPPLVIVIGIPNCIFLINKYQQEIQKHGNKAKSLQRVITKVGNATLMTNLTTASGFATFILTESSLLKEFGIVASLNIVGIFILSLTIIPIIYSYLHIPRDRHLKHLNFNWTGGFVRWMENMVRHRRSSIFGLSLLLLITSIIGIYSIRVSGSLLEDMPQDTGFFRDIKFFEKEFEGVMPLEIIIDTKTEKGVMRSSTLERMEELQDLLAEKEDLSDPVSVVNLVKYTKQAYYNSNPEYYELPSYQEQNFIMPYLKNLETSGENLLQSYVDSTGRYARMTVYMKDIGTEDMQNIEEELLPKIHEIFPQDRYQVDLTGKALMFQKGTTYLVKNLIISLSLAILLVAMLMAWIFRSLKMILISLLPNLLPLLITAGLMGYLGVPIKPSTILVFSIAFGISVDDTIHFLAKYRQELKASNWKIKKSVLAALRETGVSMFYTSIVLFFGFSVFMISSFGGTVALGGLVSATLLFAMLSNLLFLPALLLTLNKEVDTGFLKEPALDIISEDENEVEENEAEEDKGAGT